MLDASQLNPTLFFVFITRHLSQASIASDSGGAPAPYRSTLVVVCPGCTSLEDFNLFDDVVQTINESRRHARRFVVDDVADKMREAAIDELTKSDDLEVRMVKD